MTFRPFPRSPLLADRIDSWVNNWESRSNCPFQISYPSVWLTLPRLIFLPHWSTLLLLCVLLSPPLSPIPFLATSLLIWPSPPPPPPLLCSCTADVDLIQGRAVQGGIGCSLGWPAALRASSVSQTRCCFRVLLGAVSLSLSLSGFHHSACSHTHTHTLSSVSLSSFHSPSTLTPLTYFHCTS